MVCYLINMSPRASLDGKVIHGVWTGNPIDLDNLRVFRCLTYVHISKEDQIKLDPKLKKYVFKVEEVCLCRLRKRCEGVQVMGSDQNNMVITGDVVFHE